MSPVNPADRPSWRPEPPRLPDWFTRRFPVPPGRPPKIRTPRYMLDHVLAVLGGALIALGSNTGWAALWIAGVVMALCALWQGLMNILSEQQLTDWVNSRPGEGDVPYPERPNG